MGTHFKSILRGVGSILNIAPKSNYSRFITDETASERMRSHWQNVGDAIIRAAANVKQDSEKIAKLPRS